MGSCLAKPETSGGSAVAPYSSPQAKRPNLRLYGTQLCPATARIRIALEFKGLPVQTLWVDSENDIHSQKLQLLDFMLPDQTKLPILRLEEHNLCGSSEEILQFIETTFPSPSLLLAGNHLAESVQQWVAYVRDTFSPLINRALYDGDPFSQKDHAAHMHSAFAKLDSALAKHSSKGPYFFGNHFSLVDVYLIPSLLLARPLSYFRGVYISSAHSHLLNYSKRMATFPSYAPVRMDTELLQMSVGKSLAEIVSPPLVCMIMLQHQSMLNHLQKLVHSADELTVAAKGSARIVDPVKGSIGMQFRKFSTYYGHLLDFMQEHAQMEERVVFPALEKADRGLTKSANQSHARDLPLMNGIKEDLKAVLVLEQGSAGRSEALRTVATRMRALQSHTIEHFQEEETELLPLLKAAGVGIKQQSALVGKCLNVMESLHAHLFPFLLSGLQPHEIHQYLHLLQKSLEDGKAASLTRMMGALKHSDDEYDLIWSLVKDRVPELTSMV